MIERTKNSRWETCIRPPSLQPSEVHIWKIESSRFPSANLNLESLLSSDEVERANRFKFDKDRDQFSTTRGFLRWLLGHYTGIEPTKITFEYGKWGKPLLSNTSRIPRFCFNLSHTQDIALLSFSRDLELGIDVEFMKPDVHFSEIAKSHFSPSEISELENASRGRKGTRFYRCWTRKEAVIKAHGSGLAIPLDSFSVSTKPFQHAERVPLRSRLTTLASLSLFHLDPGSSQHAASLALMETPSEIKCFELGS